MVRSVAAWMTLGCLATAHFVGVLMRVPAEHRLGRSLGAALAGLLVGVLAAILFRRFGPSFEDPRGAEQGRSGDVPPPAGEERR